MVRTPIFAAAFLALAVATLATPAAQPFLHRVARHVGLESPARILGVGDTLATLNVQSLAGAPASIAPADGRIRVINVFATWCTECRTEIPSLTRIAPSLAAQHVDLIGIDQQENPARVAQFAGTFGMQYPVYVDNDGTTRQILGARVIPTTLIVDGRGIIRFVRVGAMNAKELFALIDAARSEG